MYRLARLFAENITRVFELFLETLDSRAISICLVVAIDNLLEPTFRYSRCIWGCVH